MDAEVGVVGTSGTPAAEDVAKLPPIVRVRLQRALLRGHRFDRNFGY